MTALTLTRDCLFERNEMSEVLKLTMYLYKTNGYILFNGDFCKVLVKKDWAIVVKIQQTTNGVGDILCFSQ